MAMSMTRTLRHIERKLGYKFHQLELDENEIVDTIIDESIPTFSNFYPHMENIVVFPERDKVAGREGVFYLKTDLELLGIANVYIDGVSTPSAMPTNMSQSPIDLKIAADLQSMVVNPTTFAWEEPNKVEIFPKYNTLYPFTVRLKTVHPDHMRTIPMGLKDEFLKLALYDVQDAIYRIRRHFESINTTFANIELFMSDLESAQDKREELIERWREDQLRMHNRKSLYIF